jgi:regulator of cell morphogenesis and NO signaling
MSFNHITIKPYRKLSDLILENHFILLMLEHFEIDFTVNQKTVEDICKENNINIEVFIAIANLYNNSTPTPINKYSKSDIASIIKILKNTHVYYKEDKYPEIRELIKQLSINNPSNEIKLIEKFFKEYFNEVIEHLDYEDNIAFPYFYKLINSQNDYLNSTDFSVKAYQNHHTDIESKLNDLKNLLLKHLNFRNSLPLRRKLLFSLFELEFDLTIHSLIEERILIPMAEELENKLYE